MQPDEGGEAAVAREGSSTGRPWAPGLNAMQLVLAASVAVLLSLPGFRTAYVFDDYSFLARAQTPARANLLPDSADVFYRPVSRELYFGLLQSISPGSPIAGHVINAGLFVAIVLLGGALAKRMAGARMGIVASILLGAFGQWPVLVAWVSGSQDLFAIAFLLLALHLELSGARVEALILFTLAVLSKETALVTAPALAAIPWLQQRSRRESAVAAMQIGGIVALWILFHPGIRSLIAHGGVGIHGAYIGLDNPGRWDALLQSVPTVLNLPLTGYPTPWPSELSLPLLLACIPFLGLLWMLTKPSAESSPQSDSMVRRSSQRALILGALIGIPPLLLTALLVKHWVPYYTCFSAVGLAVAASPRLSTIRTRTLAVLLLGYLVLGVWCRGVELKPGMPTERGLAPAGRALGELEANFKRTAPTLPTGAVVYVTTMATGSQSIYLHVHNFQVLRVWYHDPSLHTLRPELQVASSAPSFLFWIDPKLHVFQVDVHDLSVRSDGTPVERFRYRSTLRSYAVGLAGIGELPRAVDILLHMDHPSTWDHAINYRIAAMLLYANGVDSIADGMLQGIPELPAQSAFSSVGNMLTIPTPPNRPLDKAAFRAFGLSWDDTRVLHALMRTLDGLGYRDVSHRLARRILEIQPGDEDAGRILAGATEGQPGDRILPPVPKLELPRQEGSRAPGRR